jgi:hypothetical protein
MPTENDLTTGEGTHAIRVSLIIPCWKDSDAAIKLGQEWREHPLVHEVIITGVRSLMPSTAETTGLTICCSDEAGRGIQMNLGAGKATGDVLLFHHVDSELTEAHLVSLRDRMRQIHIVGGAFYRKFDERHPFMQWAESVERWHSRAFGTLYGDQSIFVRRDQFVKLGGFAPVPLMEDVEFSGRLRRAGEIALLDPPMSSSPLRQMEEGSWRTTGRNLLFLILFELGVSPGRLHSWYYRKRNASDRGAVSENMA